MEINKRGSFPQEHKQMAFGKRAEATEVKPGKEQQTIDSGAGAKATTIKSVEPGGEAAKGQNGPAQGRQAAQTQAAQQSLSALPSLSSTSDADDDATYQAIVTKADSGQTLTASELSTLRAKDPARYNRAVQAQNARQSLRQEMEKTPSAAHQVAKEAIAAIQAGGGQADALQAHGAISEQDTLIKALNDEYTSFARQYDQVIISGE